MSLRLNGIRRIAVASSLWNFSPMSWLSHVWVDQSIKSATLHSHSSSGTARITLLVGCFGIHLSFVTRIPILLPTLQQCPLSRISWAAKILFQMKELLGTSTASKNPHLGKYFALKQLSNNESFPCINLHPCLASIARLKLRISRKPIPPSFLGVDSVSQLLQWIFLSLPTCPHQNLAHIALSSLQNLTSNWKTPIV